MKTMILGVGDFGASKDSGATIKTYALGSCIAVILYDPNSHTAGMVHVALPDSKISAQKTKQRPGYFADTGIPVLLQKMKALNGNSVGRGLVVKLVGGAAIMDKNDVFNIGKRNHLAIKKILWGLGFGPVAEDVGGNFSRTVSVATDSGAVLVTSPGRGQWQI